MHQKHPPARIAIFPGFSASFVGAGDCSEALLTFLGKNVARIK
jgi:hypothetical protein